MIEVMVMSSSFTVQIGTQTVTPKVEDKGNQQKITFQVKITSYLGKPVDQTISVEILCDKNKLVATSPFQPPQRVEKTPQECVDEWVERHKNIYTFE